MTEVAQYQVETGVAVITVKNRPINALSQSVRTGLASAVDRFQPDEAAGIAIIVGAGGIFIGGLRRTHRIWMSTKPHPI